MDYKYEIIATAPNGATLQRGDGYWAVCPPGLGPQHTGSSVVRTEEVARRHFEEAGAE